MPRFPAFSLPPRWRYWPALLLSGGAYGLLAYATPRAHFGQLLGLLAVAFGACAWLLRAELPLRAGLAAAAVLRLLWLPALPALSDDYHRFRWDGLLVASGQNPFRYRPDELMGPAAPGQPVFPTPPPARKALYQKLNSPHYYSVYPPVCQAVFGLAAALFPTSERGFVLVLRLAVLAAEAATAALLLWLLAHFGLPRPRALLYLLNPLVIVELTGNLHFEALLITLLLAALALLARGRRAWSAGALGLAVATKLLPLLVLPLLARRLGPRRFAAYALLTGLTLLLSFAPFLTPDLLAHLGRSLRLYFQLFGFNASLYYLLRAAGFYLNGYVHNLYFGPALALAAATTTLLLAARERQPTLPSLPPTLLLTLTAYYLLSPVVHPWYLTPLVALSVFTRYRYALVWSGLVAMSYAAYQTAAYTESFPLIGLEYGLLLLVLTLELRRKPGPKPA
ncbi:glycosyltransferase 87 family protein [uncultured Hymenobacter sp.]|uniref:glycosyltransferase 87 family protein n=1 Tax=uncultured Hymenobacter sp. TaxID=170016 RepID=UPI0035CC8D98